MMPNLGSKILATWLIRYGYEGIPAWLWKKMVVVDWWLDKVRRFHRLPEYEGGGVWRARCD